MIDLTKSPRPRYINASERTTALAEGIYLKAKVMNLPAVQVETSPELEAYLLWELQWGTEMSLTASQEQFNLFDRVNARGWG